MCKKHNDFFVASFLPQIAQIFTNKYIFSAPISLATKVLLPQAK
jgi:hypothetical protein